MSNLLVADDEIRIREVIKEYGEAYGHQVQQACDGIEAIELLKKNSFDCVILDIMMPNMDGYSTLKKIRSFSNVPVIMLSARTEEEDKLYGFELGIDDYVAKPFSPKELMARIKAVTERHGFKSNNNPVKGIEIDHIGHVLKIDGKIVHVTNKEFDMLDYLIQNRNTVITRDQLMEKIWGYDNSSQDRTVDTHIKMLRKNIEPYGNKIVTVRGIGYKFED